MTNNNIKCPANYYELHSIINLSELCNKNSTSSLLISYIFCLYAIDYNITRIVTSPDLIYTFNHKRLKWLYKLLIFSNEIKESDNFSKLESPEYDGELKHVQYKISKNIERFNSFLEQQLSDNIFVSQSQDVIESLHLIKLVLFEFGSFNENNLHDNIEKDISFTIKKIVYGSTILETDFVLEFRLMHQIQETLFIEINYNFEEAISLLNSKKLAELIEVQTRINLLFTLVFTALRILMETLSINDYHSFRHLLGESSGIQSTNICTNCFKKLFPLYSSKIEEIVIANQNINFIRGKHKIVLEQAIKISKSVHNWKELHLFFPRYFLGGTFNGVSTSSMIGIKDGLKTAENMMNLGLRNDALTKYYRYEENEKKLHFPVSDLIIEKTAKLTQLKFAEVQNKAHGI